MKPSVTRNICKKIENIFTMKPTYSEKTKFISKCKY